MKKLFTNHGQALVELVLAMGIAAIIFPALLAGFMTSREGKTQQGLRMQAVALLKQTEQAVRSVKDSGWTTFAVNGTYHTTLSGNTWALAANSAVVNGFTQEVVISDVNRNNNGDIVMSGGTLDPMTKRVVMTISWSTPMSSSITSTIYYGRTTPNLSGRHTLTTDFTPGVLTNTQVTNDSGGEIKLANNNKGKWCSPSFAATTIDLPDGPPVAVSATASAAHITTPNDVYVASSPSTSNSIKLAYIKVAADTDSPLATLSGKFTMDAAQYSNPSFVPSGTGLDNNFKTNDVKYYKSSSGKTYALLATDLPTKEVIAILTNDNDSSNDTSTAGEYADPTNKIFKYWTYFNTQISSPVTADTGFVNPTANAAQTTTAGDNDGYGSNPTRGYSDNNSFALDTNSGNGTGTSCTGTDKDKHRYYNYGLSVPSGATINGIEVRLDARVDATGGSPKLCVELSWDGGTTWTTAKSTNTLTTSEATYTLGGSADTWGHAWNTTQLSNSNFRLRVINVASDTNRDFSLDWAAVKVTYNTSTTNDQAPHDYGGVSLTVLGNRGYVASGGYLYVFDLSNIDGKSTSSGLDMVGCRIELDGYDCKPGSPAIDIKYDPGETGTTWGDSGSPAHNDCSDGGNIELYATNDIYAINTGGSTYVFAANGGGTTPELNIVNASTVPTSGTSPAISSSACGDSSSSNANSGWKRVGDYDFNSDSGTEEAANSVFAKDDGTRAYITSNGGTDSKQYYVINTTDKSDPVFLSGNPGTGPTSGFYNATGANGELYPRRSLTVQNGLRTVLVGKDGTANGNNALEYQVINMETPNSEAAPAYCGGVDFDTGFNDLTSVSELDGDNYVYMVANSTNNELKIIQGGPDNAIFVSSGTYESPIFDAGFSAGFNSFVATVSAPASTTLQMQVAAAPPVSGSCTGASYTYVGPNGDPSLYFTPNTATISAVIPFGDYLSNAYQNPGRCFRYKTWMSTTDQTRTPVLLENTWNYSP
jgi:type II secretory pathway pseudopilin PulG